MEVLAIFILLLALGAAIAASILIVPESKGRQFTGFMRMLHDVLNFKQLLIEKILKFCYIFTTALFILAGVFGGFYTMTEDFGSGFAMLLFAPTLGSVLVRLAYEGMMMMVLMVKNIIDINKKMPGTPKDPEPVKPAKPAYQPAQPTYQPNPASYQNPYQPAQPTYQQPVQPAYTPNYRYCTHCGAYYDANAGRCPNCGNQ